MPTLQTKSNNYDNFVEKFRPSTDDCMTPPEIKEEIRSFFRAEFSISEPDVDPFYPGGDYQSENYDGVVVIANPPFSCLAKIVDWYLAHGVKFVLYDNALTACSLLRHREDKIGLYFIDRAIKYLPMHAKVRTGFVTNFCTGMHYRANIFKDDKKVITRAERPANVMTGVDFIREGRKEGRKDWEIVKFRAELKLYGGAVEIREVQDDQQRN